MTEQVSGPQDLGFCLEAYLGGDGPDLIQMMGRVYTRAILGLWGTGGSPKVQEGPDVVVPGERPEHLHHFGHVLLSTRQRGGKTLYPTRCSSLEDLGFFPP